MDLFGWSNIAGCLGLACLFGMPCVFIAAVFSEPPHDRSGASNGHWLIAVLWFFFLILAGFWWFTGTVTQAKAVTVLENTLDIQIQRSPANFHDINTWTIDGREATCYARGIRVRELNARQRSGPPRLYCENASGTFERLPTKEQP